MSKFAGLLSGASFAAFLRNLYTAQATPKAHSCQMAEMEPRLLLSAPPVATHDFSITHHAGANGPFDYASPVGLTPAQIRHAYGIDTTQFGSIAGDGSGQTIAIVDAYDDPTIVADLTTFDQVMGLPNTTLTVVGQNGSSVRPSTDPSGRGDSWAVEISLDVEWAHAVAPKANILLVEASSDSDSSLFAAINTARNYAGVSVVSMSWGSSEFSGENSYDSYFTTPAGHNGVTFVASSGDDGTINFPSSSPNVLAVGGTYLNVDASGNYISESGWGNGSRSSSLGGSGGGISQYESQPTYQNGVVTQSTTRRTTPDVAMDADPNSGVAVIDSWDFGTSTPWVAVGGTSLSSPLWAGVVAIADQGRVLAGQGTMDGRSVTLPKLYALPSSDFHDVVTGNTSHAAGAGYDLVTGRGTPIVNLLVAGLVGPTQAVPVVGSLTASPTSGLSGTTVTLTAANVQESSGTATISSVAFYLDSNGLAGLQTGGDTLLTGATQNGTTWTVTTSTAGLATGTYTYYAIATDSSNVVSAVASTTFQVTAPAPAAPANDNFASAAVLTGNTATATGNNATATKEAGEPNIANNPGGKSVWYTWTATTTGQVTINTRGSTFDTLLGVYTGSSVSALTLVASNDDEKYGTLTSLVTFGATQGTTYHIAVDGYNYGRGAGAASGNIVLNVSLVQGPANDNFAKATVLTGTSATWTGTNTAATREVGEPTIANQPGGASIWFAWVAPSSGKVTINTQGSKFDTLLGVYTGTAVSSLTVVAANDDVSRTNLTSAVSFTAAAGTTYYIAVDGYRGATGTVVLNLAEAALPAYDSFAGAAVVTGSTLTWTGTNVGASTEAGEPRNAGVAGGASVWVAWVAPTAGTVSLDTHGSNFDTTLGVYTGSSVSTLTSIAANDDDWANYTLTSAVQFTALAGQTYYFSIDGYHGAMGNITLNLLLA